MMGQSTGLYSGVANEQINATKEKEKSSGKKRERSTQRGEIKQKREHETKHV